MSDRTSDLCLTVTLGPGAITDETAISSLRNELLEVRGLLRVHPANAAAEHSSPGTPKSPMTLGLVGLTLTAAPFALRQVTTVIKAWLERQKSRTLILEVDGKRLEMTALTNKDQEAALEFFIQRHSTSASNSTQESNQPGA
ncbi:hypothetical protein OG601_24965 [Streptomyces sp. NBC_01239]|uniref:hypothetical protein n=1 Tax=Streptomyces sp. NBC_01239 TaxID=2903792 RepID=UPI00224DD078|nr:hypothetical protein [Streptomyces sp. NBC_01239]MCX4813852.1 hypothetical protein [Streptomyces sp. NBC_01239]